MKPMTAIETPNGESFQASTGFAPLDFTKPADEQIAIALKSAILSMQLPPGQLISEMEVGRIFGASRTPVRAAFAQLREEGLLVTWPSRGTFVTNLSLKSIKAAQFLREAIEVTVVQELCKSGFSDGSQDAISKNLDDQQDAIDQNNGVAFRLLDDQFHILLAEATGYNRIVAALNREKAVLDRLRSMTLTSGGVMKNLRSDHMAIFTAIQERDFESAIDQLRTHVRLTMKTLTGLVEKNRGYFDLDETMGEL